ncbi:MAG: ATP-dependent helicase [Pirellulales bacterium]|nr:ATP-dependent helicase [Pirellulales bacterium]
MRVTCSSCLSDQTNRTNILSDPVSSSRPAQATRVWGGTFHAIATRLLRRYGASIGLDPNFTIHDRADSEDLLNVVRTDLGLARTDKRFPKKGTCMAIYSRCVNAREKLPQVLQERFPWCDEWAEELKQLFDAYVDRKEATAALDYDDLLLYWHGLLADPTGGESLRKRFDCVLVDEYQDTNRLQAEILVQLCPEGRGLTVVGDDAQAIYSFRAATVRNILDFPKQYPGTTIVRLEQNYRSTSPILAATNEVIRFSPERYPKDLWSHRSEGERPLLVTCESEDDQTEFVVRKILEHREAGVDLRRQAVLFRASHHSILLEAELSRRNIPFHKYGGLKFIETAHVKDLMAFLRLAENPRDLVSGTRLLGFLPGIGPRKARQLMDTLIGAGGNFQVWRDWRPPAASAQRWPNLVELVHDLSRAKGDLPGQIHRVRKFYEPLVAELYDNPRPRCRDLEQIEQIASRYADRRTMLADITLDPPSSSQDLAGPPLLDDDYLVLSTIHSAKGLEWDAVYVLHAADGNIPSDMATGNSEEIEEERRLFYVALTRAKNSLVVCHPLRYYHYPTTFSDRHGYAQLTRFLPEIAKQHFHCCVTSPSDAAAPPDPQSDAAAGVISARIRQGTKGLWA